MTDFMAFGISPFGKTPTQIQIEHMNLEKKAFFHFGMNTFTNAEWGDGNECSSLFNPSNVDCRQWIRSIKAAGFKLAIITVKHHDGFCLWPSKYTEHSVKHSPYMGGKSDIIRDFTDACREYGIKVGLYISPWDRNSKYWGSPEYSDHYANQLRELLSGYGRIDEIWWDGAGSSETVYKWNEWADIIHELQPHAGIFGSLGATEFVSFRWVGNERGFAGETHYASIDASSLETETTSELNRGKICGNRYIPAEVDVSIRPGWFYHPDQKDKVKSPEEIDDIWFNSVGRNAMMLINIPPNRDGILEELDVSRIVESNERIERMRANDLIRGARLTANSVHSEKTVAQNILEEGDDKFYASQDKTAVINIELPTRVTANVFALGEVFEFGERIVSFKLTDRESGDTVCESTSVGRLKAVRFEPKALKSLTLEIEALAPVTVKRMHLYFYEAPKAKEKLLTKENLMKGESARVEMNAAKTSAILNFGGIFPFNTISYKTAAPSEYRIEAFDGTEFYTVAEGISQEAHSTVSVDTVSGAYQIRITVSESFDSNPEFSVT